MSEPGGVTPGGILGVIGAVLALIGGPTAIGKVATWLADRGERRRANRADGNREWEAKLKAWDKALKAREREITRRLKAGLDECKRECEAVRKESDEQREDNRVLVLALGLAVQKVAQSAPASAELGVIHSLLNSRFRVDLDTPTDLTALLAVLDRQTV